MYQPSVKSVYETNHFTNIKHTQTSDTNFRRVSPFDITPVKEHIRLGHAGIVNHSVQFIDTRLKQAIKKEWTDTI